MYFSVIGDDKRMDYVMYKLENYGCKVCRNIEDNEIQAVVLPPGNNFSIFQQLARYNHRLMVIYGGNIPGDMTDLFQTVKLVDYLLESKLVYFNAILTAKGIIQEALKDYDSLDNLEALVIGYGFCGKAIANELSGYCNNITVAVRNSGMKDNIINEGYSYIDINQLSSWNSHKFKCIFNTVPAMVIDSLVVEYLDKSACIYDIASKPGGVDFEYCKTKNIQAKLYPGIPGKMYPKEAGFLIGDFCFNHFKKYINPPK